MSSWIIFLIIASSSNTEGSLSNKLTIFFKIVVKSLLLDLPPLIFLISGRIVTGGALITLNKNFLGCDDISLPRLITVLSEIFEKTFSISLL